MDPIQVPEDLTTLSEDELTELGLEIKERVETLADDAKKSDDSLSEVEGLIADFDRINAELASREAAAAEREERIGAALERFAPEAQDAETDEDDSEEVATEDASDEDDDEFSTEDTVEAAVEEVFETETEAPVEASVETPEETERSVPTVAALRTRRPAAAAPQPRADEFSPGVTRSRVTDNGVREGEVIDWAKLSDIVVDKRRQFNNVPTGTFEKVVLASSTRDFEYNLGTGHEENFEVLKAVRAAHLNAREEVNAIVASGGNCAPLEQEYDFYRLAEELNPTEQCLPLVGSPRGGIRFISPPDFRDAAPGVRVTTEAEDAAGYTTQTPPGPTDPKPCVSVVCPPIEECRVDVVSRCVRWGNLNFRVFPEQVESFMSDLAVIFTETKEIFYLDAIDANSTAVTAAPTYGAVRSMISHLARAAANYRRRQHMSADAVLELFLPSWVAELIYVDMVNDHSLGLNFVGDNPVTAVSRALAELNLNVCFYYDSATGAGQAFNGAQGAGALNEFPTTVRSYLFAPGTFVRLNAGTLDVGMIRDSFLNGTNDLEMFAEEWIQVCFVGLESLRIDHTLCPDGTAPEPVAPIVCP